MGECVTLSVSSFLFAVRRPGISLWPTDVSSLRGKDRLILSYSILVVDDSALIRRSLKLSLEQNPDWKVCGEAVDGLEAIELVPFLKPDIVVLDLAMPGMNGFEVARELHRTVPLLPVLMFTNHATPRLESEARAAGCSGVVSKSDHQQILFDNIQRLLTPEINA